MRATHVALHLEGVETTSRTHLAMKTRRLQPSFGWMSGCRAPRKGMYERLHVVSCPGRQEETWISWKMASEQTTLNLTLACGKIYILKKHSGLATLSVGSGGEWN